MITLLLLTLLITMTACGGTVRDREERLAELRARPDQATAAAELRSLVDQVRGRLETELGIDGWFPFGRGPSRSACIGNTDIKNAEEMGLKNWGRTGPIPDNQWPRAVQILIDVTAPHGFDRPSSPVSRPGQHDVTIRNQYGAEISLGTSVNTSIGGRTGCHLRIMDNNP